MRLLLPTARLAVLLHLAVLAGLLGALLLTPVAEGYFTRGVTSDPRWPPLPHTDGNPMAINTFLNEEVDPETVRRSLDMIAEAGFGTIRQVFGWYEIEPERGRFEWEKYDRIVALAHERDLEIIARLERPPAWARAGQPNPEIPGPPDQLDDYARFVEAVVERYRGTVRYVQIWNEPNLEGEWGGGPIDPHAYVQLLRAGAEAARRADPNIVVLLAGLAPTDQRGPQNLSDLLFLQRVYDFGGAPYFDIAAVMVYGFGASPGDRRVDFWRNNFSRPIQTREVMLRNGDGGTPIWAVEYGWVSLPDDWQGRPSVWGPPVDEETQGRYLVEGYLRAQREWPWMGRMAVWAFRFPRPADAPDQQGNPTRGFTLVEHDFTPRPAWEALRRAAPRIQRQYTGAYWLSDAQRAQLAAGESVTLRLSGTALDLVVHGSGGVSVDDGSGDAREVRWTGAGQQRRRVIDDLGRRDVTLRLLPGTDATQLEGYVVRYRAWQLWLFPWLRAGLALAALAVAAALAWRLRLRAAWSQHRASVAQPRTAGEPVTPFPGEGG